MSEKVPEKKPKTTSVTRKRPPRDDNDYPIRVVWNAIGDKITNHEARIITMSMYMSNTTLAKELGVRLSYIEHVIAKAKKFVPDLRDLRRKMVANDARRKQLLALQRYDPDLIPDKQHHQIPRNIQILDEIARENEEKLGTKAGSADEIEETLVIFRKKYRTNEGDADPVSAARDVSSEIIDVSGDENEPE